MAAIAWIAGGEPLVALRLGLSMTALQLAIGALNDLVDAPADAGHKPGKPIPAGLVSPAVARGVVIGSAAVGLALAVPGGPSLVALALVVLGIGAAYDLVAKGTALSWLPFALGIPILPLYGWLGATGEVPGWFAVLLPAGVLAGAALAIANARVDVERDAAAGRGSVAVALGLDAAWWVALTLVALALGLIVAAWPPGMPAWAIIAVAVGTAFTVAGAARAWRADQRDRERAWQLQAIGVGLVAVGWVAGAAT